MTAQNHITIFTCLLAVLLMFSNLNAQNRRSSFTEYYPSGEAKAAGTLKKELKVGEWTTFTKPGMMTSRIRYRKGLMDGQAKYYFETEELQAFGMHRKGIKQGKWSSFHENNRRESKGRYDDGIKDKVWKYWNSSGFLVKIEEYEEGKLIRLEEKVNL